MIGKHGLRLIFVITSAAVVLGLASTIGIVLFLGGEPIRRALPWTSGCPTPSLTGSVVDVTLGDMGGMMGPGVMGPGMMGNGVYGPGAASNGYPWQNGHAWPGNEMMRVVAVPSAVPAGTVSLRVRNTGALTHEVVVIPLGLDRYPGQRAIGVDGMVDESGSLGEASHTCGAGHGEGIRAGADAWTTITLPPGRYELLCNIAGHYGAGMYTELDTFAR
jgi:uncharacterized cupredoxin-like copper-binding protein